MDERLLSRARSLFPHTGQGKVYLNHAATSPLSTRVVDAMTAYLRDRSTGALDTYHRDFPMVAECRSMIQRLIHAGSPERIAIAANTSDAINIVASGLDWKSGDHVLLNDLEFPANVWPYRNLAGRGVEVDVIAGADGKISPEAVERGIASRTRLVALSAVQFLTGYRADLAAIGGLCRDRGILFAVDGIQAVGALRIDVRSMNIDALAAGAQKWLMGPHGAGFLYLTEELQSRIRQTSLGWLGVSDPWDFTNYRQGPAPSARRYEGGSLNMPSLWGFHAALSTLQEAGDEQIERQILDLSGLLTEELGAIGEVSVISPSPEAQRSGIVTVAFRPPIDAREVFKRLLERNVVVALREGKLRYSPHFYNSREEILTAAAATRECLRAPLARTNTPSHENHVR